MTVETLVQAGSEPDVPLILTINALVQPVRTPAAVSCCLVCIDLLSPTFMILCSRFCSRFCDINASARVALLILVWGDFFLTSFTDI